MMRRSLAVLTIVAALAAIPAPVAAHDPVLPCSVSVSPETGGRHAVYRITGYHFPRRVGGGSLEVQIDIMRVVFDDSGVHLKLKTIFVLTLVPDIHTFYVDYNQPTDGTAPLAPGHYIVAAETPHQPGCRTISSFDVRRLAAPSRAA